MQRDEMEAALIKQEQDSEHMIAMQSLGFPNPSAESMLQLENETKNFDGMAEEYKNEMDPTLFSPEETLAMMLAELSLDQQESLTGEVPMQQQQQIQEQVVAGPSQQQQAGMVMGPQGDGVPQPVLRPQGTPIQGMQAHPNQLLQRTAIIQLLQTLNSPNTPERKEQILHILKSNPPLLAAFIKQRKAAQQRQQAGQQQTGQQQVQYQEQQPIVPLSGSSQQQADLMMMGPQGYGIPQPVLRPPGIPIQSMQAHPGQPIQGMSLTQMMQTYKWPYTPEQQAQINHALSHIQSPPQLSFVQTSQMAEQWQQAGTLGQQQTGQQQVQHQEQQPIVLLVNPGPGQQQIMVPRPQGYGVPQRGPQLVLRPPGILIQSMQAHPGQPTQEMELLQLLRTYKSPCTPEQQAQINCALQRFIQNTLPLSYAQDCQMAQQRQQAEALGRQLTGQQPIVLPCQQQAGTIMGPQGGGVPQPVWRPQGIPIQDTPTHPGQPMQRMALIQFLKALKTPNTSERQKQILHLVQSNPQFKAAFIRHRKARMGQQQQQARTLGQQQTGQQQQLQYQLTAEVPMEQQQQIQEPVVGGPGQQQTSKSNLELRRLLYKGPEEEQRSFIRISKDDKNRGGPLSFSPVEKPKSNLELLKWLSEGAEKKQASPDLLSKLLGKPSKEQQKLKEDLEKQITKYQQALSQLFKSDYLQYSLDVFREETKNLRALAQQYERVSDKKFCIPIDLILSEV